MKTNALCFHGIDQVIVKHSANMLIILMIFMFQARRLDFLGVLLLPDINGQICIFSRQGYYIGLG